MLQDEVASALGIGKSQLSKWKARGCPVDDLAGAQAWRSANIKPRAKRRKATSADPASEIPPAEAKPVEPVHTWEARLERARKTEVDVFDATQAAMGRREYNQLQSLLASYQRALQGIAEAEATALETRIKTGELVHRDTARAIMAELLLPIRNALDLLPVTERSRCNPQHPDVAENALRAWKDALLLRLSQADTKF